MLLSIFFMLKTILYLSFTQVEHNRIAIFLITSLITILAITLIYRTKWKHKKAIALTFYSIVSVIMFIDVIFYSQFAALPSVVMLSQTKQLTAVTESIKHLLGFKNMLLILDIPFLILILRYIDKENIKMNLPKLSKNTKTFTILGVLILTFIYVNVTDQMKSVSGQEFYSFHTTDVVNNIKGEDDFEERDKFTEEDLKDLEERTKLEEGYLTGVGKDRNLIVLQIEALQEFVIGLEYEGQEVTPNINKLIGDRSTIYYDEYYQLLGRGNTSDTEFVSHNSVYPSMEEPSYTQYEKNTFYGLPWLLQDYGYSTWVFHGYEKEFWNRDAAYPNQGFERFLSEEDYDYEEEIGFGIRDEDFLEQSIEYLKELDSVDDNPFYAFLITLTSHTPYIMDEEYDELDLKEEEKDTLLGDYLQAIHYTDKYVGGFIEDLKEEGLYDNSIIATYGDHFAIPNTKEDVKETMSEFLGEEYDFDRMSNIPLTITIPGEDINETSSTVGSPLDFYPTMMNILGYENEKGLVFGRDLNNYKEDNFIAPQTYMLKGSFIDDDTMFIMSRDGVFEHSKAIDMKTRKDLDPEDFKDEHEMAIKEINNSEFLLRNDFLKTYLEEDGKIDLKKFNEIDLEELEKDNSVE